MKLKGLGRGLDALLAANEGQSREEQRMVTTDRLKPGKYQPRTRMDPASLQELAASIKSQGLMQPILVRPLTDVVGKEQFEIIAGERRWRAAQIAEVSEIPVLVREIPDESALVMALIENIQRENLNPLEEAQGLQRLINEFSMTHQQAADAVGRSRPTASNLLRLLQLADPVQDFLINGQIDMGHARALLTLPKAMQIQLAQQIVQKGLSVRETEKLVQQASQPAKKVSQPEKPDRDLIRLQDELSDHLGAQVQIKTNRRGAGKIQIEFSNLDELEGLLQRIRSQEEA